MRPRRGVVFSHIRKGWERNEFDNHRVDPLKCATRIGRSWWLNQRLAYEFCQRKSIPFQVISYDVLCSSPESALSKIGHLIEVDYSGIGKRLEQGDALILPPHLIRGNRKLRSQKDIRLRRDESYLKHGDYVMRILAGLGTLEAKVKYFASGNKMLKRMMKVPNQ